LSEADNYLIGVAFAQYQSVNLEGPKLNRCFCPYSDCPSRSIDRNLGTFPGRIVRKGSYFRRDDSKWISRFRCLECNRSFSSSRLTERFGQKKRTINRMVYELLSSGVNQRRAGRILRVNRKTIIRKFLFEAAVAKRERLEFLGKLATKEDQEKIDLIHFDEMETFEHSKCLPVSIPLVVDPKTRKILTAKVASMPAKGLLSAVSLKKYGPRNDERPEIAHCVFSEILSVVRSTTTILSDQNPKYGNWIRRVLPKAAHKTVKGLRGCVVGQGELKASGHDPLFALNHSAAMIRANVNRLFRRTWCTTKRRDRLEAHLELYIKFHNTELVPQIA